MAAEHAHPARKSSSSDDNRCGCDESKALRAELDELRAAAYALLPWIDRSLSVARDGAKRLEVALAQPEPKPAPSRCVVTTVFGLSGARCELPTGHTGHHRWCQIEWR